MGHAGFISSTVATLWNSWKEPPGLQVKIWEFLKKSGVPSVGVITIRILLFKVVY